ncbi:MAG: phospholipase D-like domain-containing protein [Sandaracinus sp.]
MTSRRLIALALLVLPLVGGCPGTSDPGGGMRDGGPTGSDVGPLPSNAVAVLEIQVLDLWAQPMPGDTTVSVSVGGMPVTGAAAPLVTVPLTGAGTIDVAVTADGHVPLGLALTFDGTALTAGAFDAGARHGLSISHDTRTFDGRSLPVHTVFLGVRHAWFSAQGRPARRGNHVRLMTSGEEAWSTVATELRAATDHIHAATWWWESDFELERDAATHVTSTPADRQAHTILGILDASTATRRVLVNQLVGQDGLLSWATSDSPIRDRGAAAGDGFELMGEANETHGMFDFEVRPFTFGERVRAELPEVAARTFDTEQPIASTVPSRPVDLTLWPISIDVDGASFHQKFMTIDGEVAFVGGMNLRRVDWDTDQHLVFEPRRMLFDASTADRMAVASHERLPDTGPRKDFMTRLEGPIVEDVEELFHMRWAHQIEAGVDYSENASDYTVARDQPAFADGVQAQLTATLPAPYSENAIAETWWNAIANAEDYIYIEDQYFRVPMLQELIVQRMTDVPALQLVVITKPIDEITDPGCEQTYMMVEALETAFPTRFHLLQLRAFDIVDVGFGIDETEERYTDFDVHSKLLIVDDVFLSVGSANKNNRGIVYEGELNVAIYDRAWVTAARERILRLILPSDVTPASTSAGWITQLEEAAAYNDAVWSRWDSEGGDISLDGAPLPVEYTPRGFVHSMAFDVPSECLIEGVGPDMT